MIRFTLVVEIDDCDSALPYLTMLAAVKEGASVVTAELDYKGRIQDVTHMLDTINWCLENSND
jgi:hypothetical protein